MSSSQWFQNPIYRRYWENYDKSLRWHKKHCREWRRISRYVPNKPLNFPQNSQRPEVVIERENFESEPKFELQITEELISFLEQSAQHRKQLKLDREIAESENGCQNDEHFATSSLKPPDERPGALHAEQMKLLYGTDAAMIHGMETAMDLAFQRHCDLRHPKPWPNIPLGL